MMKPILTLITVLCLIGIAFVPANATTIVLYENDFESPSNIVLGPNYKDVSQQSLNSLFGPEFQQTFTVETIAINGPANWYSDPAGTGGNYAAGMLGTVQNDIAALTFDTQMLPFLNLSVDISGIELTGPAAPFVTGAPEFKVSLLDTPGGVFNFGGGYDVLDSAILSGTLNPDSKFIFSWTNHLEALDATNATTGEVTLMFDLVKGGYASFDNLKITSSDTPIGQTPEPATLWLFASVLAMIPLRRFVFKKQG